MLGLAYVGLVLYKFLENDLWTEMNFVNEEKLEGITVIYWFLFLFLCFLLLLAGVEIKMNLLFEGKCVINCDILEIYMWR